MNISKIKTILDMYSPGHDLEVVEYDMISNRFQPIRYLITGILEDHGGKAVLIIEKQYAGVEYGPPDPDYRCGAAFCDDPACLTHGPCRNDDGFCDDAACKIHRPQGIY